MGFVAASSSIFSAIANAVRLRHTWRYDECRGHRICTCCGRQEEMIIDLVTSDWAMLEPGDDSAHAKKAVGIKPEPKIVEELAPAHTEATVS